MLDPPLVLPLFTPACFSIIAFLVAVYLIPACGPLFIEAGLKGKDKAEAHDDDMYVRASE